MTDTTTVATQLINDELGSTGVRKIPSSVMAWCVSQVAKRITEIEALSNGIVQYGPDGESSFLPGDPLAPVMKTLNRYKGIGGVG